MSAEADVLKAAPRRAEALGRGDRAELESLLHPQLVWTSYTGEQFDRRSYLDANTGARTRWHGQRLADADVRFVGEVAVLRCTVTDDVTTDAGRNVPHADDHHVGRRPGRGGVAWPATTGRFSPEDRCQE